MTNIEERIHLSNVEQSDPEAKLTVTELPRFQDIVQDFYHDKKAPLETNHNHQFWRDVVEVGTTKESAREYAVVTAIPENQLVEQPIVMTTALLTSTRGHNFNTAIHLLNLGYPVIMIGSEGEQKSQKTLHQQLNNARYASLPQTTHNAHVALSAISSIHNTSSYRTFDDKNIISLGESRGAMIGMGLPAYAHEHDRKVIYSDLTAPCFPEKLDYGIKSLVDVYRQGRAEFVALKGLAKTLGLKRVLHYPNTLNLRPGFQLQAFGYIPALVSGDAGLMARHIPENTPMHIKTFNEDYWSQPDNWKSILGNHPEISIKVVDGSHLTIAARETLNHIENRLINLRTELIKSGGNTEKIDFSKVHLFDRDNQETLPDYITVS